MQPIIPTVSEHIAAGRVLVGAVARMRRYDTRAQEAGRDVYAVVEQVGDLAEDLTRLTIRGDYRPSQTRTTQRGNQPDRRVLLPVLNGAVSDIPSAQVEEDHADTLCVRGCQKGQKTF